MGRARLTGQSGGVLKINGQYEKTVVCLEDIQKYDTIAMEDIYNFDTYSNYKDIELNTTGVIRAVAFSSDDHYIAIGTNYDDFLYILERDGDKAVVADIIDISPGATVYCADFVKTDNGIYLAVGLSSPPNMAIYKLDDGVFTKLSNPATVPTNSVAGVSFSKDGNYLAYASSLTPFVTIYKRSGDTFTKLPNLTDLPSAACNCIEFSNDNSYLAVGLISFPYLIVYKRSGDTFTKLADPSTTPGQNVRGLSFSSDGTYIALACQFSPGFLVYKLESDVLTKISTGIDVFGAGGLDVDFNFTDDYAVIVGSSYPYTGLYERNGDAFTLLYPGFDITSAVYSISFCNFKNRFAYGLSNLPYFRLYRGTTFDFTSAVKANGEIESAKYDCDYFGYAKEAGLKSDEIKAISILN